MGFGDYIDEFSEGFRKHKPSETVTETIAEGNKLISTDWIKEIRQIPLIAPYINGYEDMNLYQRGWRFQFGSAHSWAGLCSAAPSDVHKSKEGKNIFVSVEMAKHDLSWKENMKSVILHESAHAIVFEIFLFDKKNAGVLNRLDAQHMATQGHGIVWSAVCEAISGGKACGMRYTPQMSETYNPFRYQCVCGHTGYGRNARFARNCERCGAPVVIQRNPR